MKASMAMYQNLGTLLILGVFIAANVTWNRSNALGVPGAAIQACFMVIALSNLYQLVVNRRFLTEHRRLGLATLAMGAGAGCATLGFQVAGGGVAKMLLAGGTSVAFAGAAVLALAKAKPGAAS